MALYAIGDLHLSLNSNKSMEVFGPAWENYTERIRASLSQLTAEDVLVLAGDTSWGMNLEESVEDFRFLEQFPCKNISSRATTITGGPPPLSSAPFVRPMASPPWNCCTTTAFFTAITPSAAPGAGFGGGAEAPQRQGAEPGAAAAGDFAEGGGGRSPSSASSTIHHCIRATSARRSCPCWKPTRWSCVATAISTGR